ncbi:class I SAM-dependent methyltransferase [Haloterrigena longa]|uniref:Class I SAM-dependent methyltransferase n=2 Tax=Natrinema longum TaxID=370324 RepID=A0A8A2UE72_9EURY|nr:class I SAM-dependent methyltransferase [Natrinema longum]QSW86910.1 class I SAM-dependent methyltransferase [Natrinema longum]
MSAEEIADSYGDVADELARWSRLERLFAGRYRRRQFENAAGRVLDVACGTGRNFRYLTTATDVVGIDISDEMLAHARDELDGLALDGTLHRMDAQALAFPADSFDTVISSFATCTFPDPITALRELQRVCKPGGQLLFLEHSRSDVAPLAWLQDWRAESHYQTAGCQLNHEPLETVQKTELVIEKTDEQLFGLVTGIEATPP